MKIVVGMSGNVASLVTAYLLKRQGHQCVGLTVLFEHQDEFKSEAETKGNPASTPEAANKEGPGHLGLYHVNDLNKTKQLCDQLELPFYAVNAQDAFQDKVLEPLVAARLSGEKFVARARATEVLIEIMLQKSILLQADCLATGHFCKILKNRRTGEFYPVVASDIKNDQSYYLARLNQAQLSKLMLPLSDMRADEIQKIAQLLGATTASTNPQISLYANPKLAELVTKQSPPGLRKEGMVFSYKEDSTVVEHAGIQHYYLGQEKITGKGSSLVDPELQVCQIVPGTASIYLTYPEDMGYTHCYVKNFFSPTLINTAVPIPCFVKFEEREEKVPAYLYFKNNDNVLVHFRQRLTGLLAPGDLLVFYDRDKIGGKIIGSGQVAISGTIEKDRFTYLPIRDEEALLKEVAEDEHELVKLDKESFKF